jgi:hypothetical protein
MMRRVGWAVFGALAGGVAAAVLGIAAGEAFNISQAEGAYAMGIFFFWTPLTAILGAITGAVLSRRR